MKKLEHDLLTNKYTEVLHEKEFTNNAPHHFEVYADRGEPSPRLVGKVDFQNGAIKEAGVNGVMNEDLLVMVLTRLEHFQQSEFRCNDNHMAIAHIQKTLEWLRNRTVGREERGVEGTHKV